MPAHEIFLIRTLINAMMQAHHHLIRANHAMEPDQRNMQLGYLGSKLIKMGVISIAATMIALIQPPERIFAQHTFMPVILLVILGFIAVSGLAGITFGMFLLTMNNPRRYHYVSMVILWASSVAAAFSIGNLFLAFSPS